MNPRRIGTIFLLSGFLYFLRQNEVLVAFHLSAFSLPLPSARAGNVALVVHVLRPLYGRGGKQGLPRHREKVRTMAIFRGESREGPNTKMLDSPYGRPTPGGR
jgi:hypothetical protein